MIIMIGAMIFICFLPYRLILSYFTTQSKVMSTKKDGPPRNRPFSLTGQLIPVNVFRLRTFAHP